MASVYVCTECKKEYQKNHWEPGVRPHCPVCKNNLVQCDLVAWRTKQAIKPISGDLPMGF